MDLRNLVVIKGQPILERPVLIIGSFIGPNGVWEGYIALLQVEIMRRSLERALGRGRGSFKLVGADIRARKIVACRAPVFVNTDDIARIGDSFAVELNSQSALHVLFRDGE